MKAKKTSKRGKSAEQRQAELADLRDHLGLWEEQTPPEVVAEIIARFEGYSARNAKLIAMQCPTATDVAAYGEWQSRGRQVRKGAHGIRIIKPAGSWTKKTEGENGDETEEHLRFAAVSVFDVTMTDPKTETAPGTSDLYDDGLELELGVAS